MSWGRVWNRSYARARLIGKERTGNPTVQAASLLGKRAVRATVRRLKRRASHRWNPVPAVVATIAPNLLSKIPGLSGLLKKPSQARAGPVANALVNAAVAGNLTAAKAIKDRTTFGISKERAVWAAAAARIPPTIWTLVKKYDTQIPGVDHSTPESAGESALANPVDGKELEAAEVTAREAETAKAEARVSARRGAARAQQAAQEARESRFIEAGTRIGESLASAALSRARAPKGGARGLGRAARGAGRFAGVAGRGAGVAGGAAGAVGGASALAVAGVAIGGLAAGYWIGSQLNKHLAGRALSKEQAGVAAALAFRAARAEAERAQGAPLTAAQVRSLGAQYKRGLVELGYDPGTFVRVRSGFEKFFTGQEEED